MQFNFLTRKTVLISLTCSAICLAAGSAGYLIKKGYDKHAEKKRKLEEEYAEKQVFYNEMVSKTKYHTSNEYFIKHLKNHTKYLDDDDISLLSEIMGRYNTTIREHSAYIVSENPNDLNRRCNRVNAIDSRTTHIYNVLESDDKESIKTLMITLYTEEKVHQENLERADKLRAERQVHEEHMAKINADKEIELQKLSNERYKYSQLAGTAKAFIERKKGDDDE